MERRLFLTGLAGLVGAAAISSTLRPARAMPVMARPGDGILDELDEPGEEFHSDSDLDSGATVEEISHRHHHRRHRRKRHTWKRVCRRVWINGRRRVRCRRRRVWTWIWVY